MVPQLLMFALTDWGAIVGIVLAVAALVISTFVALQVRRSRPPGEAAERAAAQAATAGRSAAAAEGAAEAAQRAATEAAQQVAALREGLAQQAARDRDQRDAAFPRLRIVASEVGSANSVTIRHSGGSNPATQVHVILITTERYEGDITLLTAGETQACNLRRVAEPYTDYFPDLQSTPGDKLVGVAQVIWTSTVGGRGRHAVRLGDGGHDEEILHDVDLGVSGY